MPIDSFVSCCGSLGLSAEMLVHRRSSLYVQSLFREEIGEARNLVAFTSTSA